MTQYDSTQQPPTQRMYKLYTNINKSITSMIHSYTTHVLSPPFVFLHTLTTTRVYVRIRKQPKCITHTNQHCTIPSSPTDVIVSRYGSLHLLLVRSLCLPVCMDLCVCLSLRHVNNTQHTLVEHIATVISIVALLKPSNSRRSYVVCHILN